MGRSSRVAIVGGGLCGLVAASRLAERGVGVDVFDKGRGPGGRVSVRRADVPDVGEVVFPHGTALFSATTPEFVEVLEQWQRAGVAGVFAGRGVRIDQGSSTADTSRYWTGLPAMNGVCKHLAARSGVSFQAGSTVTRVASNRLFFSDGREADGYDAVLITAPPGQAAEIVRSHDSSLAERLRLFTMSPAWSVMLAWTKLAEAPFDVAFVSSSPVERLILARQPGVWVAHMNRTWSRYFLESAADDVAANAAGHVAALLGTTDAPAYSNAHRWRYAYADHAAGDGAVITADRRVVFAGDWLSDCGGVEGAFLSGKAAAQHIQAIV